MLVDDIFTYDKLVAEEKANLQKEPEALGCSVRSTLLIGSHECSPS